MTIEITCLRVKELDLYIMKIACKFITECNFNV